jgi:hypothetical protein
MSQHRRSVVAALEQLRKRVAVELDSEIVMGIHAGGIRHLTIDVLARSCSTHLVPLVFVDEMASTLFDANIDDLREAEVAVAFSFRTRHASCMVTGATNHFRTMEVLDATIRARIKTRWVHMSDETERRIEWATFPNFSRSVSTR